MNAKKTQLKKLILIPIGFAASLIFYPPVFAEIVTFTAIVSTEPTVTIDSVRPQGRVGADQTNSDTTYYVTVRTAIDSDDSVLFTAPALSATDNAGVSTETLILSGIPAGTYDMGLKGHQHLTRVLQDVPIIVGNNVLNFTQPDNSTPRGTQVLRTGDVNGAGTDPSNLGDDVVNSVDLSTLIQNIDDTDPTGNAERTNLNQDTAVNSVDISWMISNLDARGDE